MEIAEDDTDESGDVLSRDKDGKLNLDLGNLFGEIKDFMETDEFKKAYADVEKAYEEAKPEI